MGYVMIVSDGYMEALNEYRFNDALSLVWDKISKLDKYINEEKPWEGNANASQVVSDIFFALKGVSEFLLPFLPETAEKIDKAVRNKEMIQLFPRLLT